NGFGVLSTTPANAQTVTTAPTQIVVTFNQAVKFSTVAASDIAFQNLPAGVTGTVGTPKAGDDPQFPTQVAFPITINAPANVVANGTYRYVVQGNVQSKSGTALVASSPISFVVNDTTAPRVTNFNINGRIVTVKFSEPMRASSMVRSNFM